MVRKKENIINILVLICAVLTFVLTKSNRFVDKINEVSTEPDVVLKRAVLIGTSSFSKEGLEKKLEKNEMLNIITVGMFSLSDDITPELAQATIKSISVNGVFNASPQVKVALADRIQ